MLHLYLSLHLLCLGPAMEDKSNCELVVTGHNTPKGEHVLTPWSVPAKDQARYGSTWWQIGTDQDLGIHGWPHFSPWQAKVVKSHDCVRVSQSMLNKIKEFQPKSLKISE